MLDPPPERPARRNAWILLTACLLGVLVASHDLPARPDRVGPAVLGARLQWTLAWGSFHWLGLLPRPTAGSLARLDPELRSDRAQEAARWLARHGPRAERPRWAAMLAARHPEDLPLLRQTIRDALASGRCDRLRAAVAAGQAAPPGSAARSAITDGLQQTRRSTTGRGSGARRTTSSACVP
jgi:hypothetical protein